MQNWWMIGVGLAGDLLDGVEQQISVPSLASDFLGLEDALLVSKFFLRISKLLNHGNSATERSTFLSLYL